MILSAGGEVSCVAAVGSIPVGIVVLCPPRS